MKKFTVQQDCAGFVVIREGDPRRAWEHFDIRNHKSARAAEAAAERCAKRLEAEISAEENDGSI